MDNVLLVVKLECSKKSVVVPAHFVYQLDCVKTFNNSINHNQVHLIFWSENHRKPPNFNLPISNQFNEKTDACFEVKILKAFGMYFID